MLLAQTWLFVHYIAIILNSTSIIHCEGIYFKSSFIESKTNRSCYFECIFWSVPYTKAKCASTFVMGLKNKLLQFLITQLTSLQL